VVLYRSTDDHEDAAGSTETTAAVSHIFGKREDYARSVFPACHVETADARQVDIMLAQGGAASQ